MCDCAEQTRDGQENQEEIQEKNYKDVASTDEKKWREVLASQEVERRFWGFNRAEDQRRLREVVSVGERGQIGGLGCANVTAGDDTQQKPYIAENVDRQRGIPYHSDGLFKMFFRSTYFILGAGRGDSTAPSREWPCRPWPVILGGTLLVALLGYLAKTRTAANGWAHSVNSIHTYLDKVVKEATATIFTFFEENEVC
ncbi:hypothetical protein ACJJTC_018507 [Scirpophaga incertulas]